MGKCSVISWLHCAELSLFWDLGTCVDQAGQEYDTKFCLSDTVPNGDITDLRGSVIRKTFNGPVQSQNHVP